MTDYSHILPAEAIVLERDPADTSCALRSHDTALLTIDEDGGVGLSTRTLYGGDGTPMDEWHRKTLAYSLASARDSSCVLDMDRLREDLQEGGTLATLIDRVKAGHTIEWDGNNMKGRLSDDAQEAHETIVDLADDGYADASVRTCDAAFWVSGDGSPEETLRNLELSIDATAEQIAEAANAMIRDAKGERVVLIGDPEEVLRKIVAEVAKASA